MRIQQQIQRYGLSFETNLFFLLQAGLVLSDSTESLTCAGRYDLVSLVAGSTSFSLAVRWGSRLGACSIATVDRRNEGVMACKLSAWGYPRGIVGFRDRIDPNGELPSAQGSSTLDFADY